MKTSRDAYYTCSKNSKARKSEVYDGKYVPSKGEDVQAGEIEKEYSQRQRVALLKLRKLLTLRVFSWGFGAVSVDSPRVSSVALTVTLSLLLFKVGYSGVKLCGEGVSLMFGGFITRVIERLVAVTKGA